MRGEEKRPTSYRKHSIMETLLWRNSNRTTTVWSALHRDCKTTPFDSVDVVKTVTRQCVPGNGAGVERNTWHPIG